MLGVWSVKGKSAHVKNKSFTCWNGELLMDRRWLRNKVIFTCYLFLLLITVTCSADEHYLNGFQQPSLHPQAHNLEQEMMLAWHLQTVSFAHFLHVHWMGEFIRKEFCDYGNHSPYSSVKPYWDGSRAGASLSMWCYLKLCRYAHFMWRCVEDDVSGGCEIQTFHLMLLIN
jgi:hypothetical protein